MKTTNPNTAAACREMGLSIGDTISVARKGPRSTPGTLRASGSDRNVRGGRAMRLDDLTPAIRLTYASRAAATTAAGGESPNWSGEKPQSVCHAAFLRLGASSYGRPGGGSRKARRCSIGLSTSVSVAHPFESGSAVQNRNWSKRTMTTSITVLTTEVRQLDGLYSLNDLHKAAGADKAQQPTNFLRLDQTQALISEIQSSEMRSATQTINGGQNRGTYVCRELVYAYAMWISPKFNLAVIRAFDAAQNATPVFPAAGRWLAHTDDAGRIVFKPVPHDALIVSPAQLAERIAEPGGWMLSNAELAAIAQAATARLAQRLVPTDQRRAA